MAWVKPGSNLIRQKWMREGLLQAASKSFWSPYTGTGKESVVVQANNASASEGHTIVFDYDGNLSGKAIKGAETAFGKGEQKKKFSNKLTVDRYRLVVDNGDAFDAVNVGDLNIAEHSDSRSKLSDLFVRWKDQMLFDTLQGLHSSAPTHIIDLTATFGWDQLQTIETRLKTGGPWSTGATRRPLAPFTLADGRPVWLMVMDTYMTAMLKADSKYQSLIYNADVRGNDNRAIKGIFGKLGSLILVEAPTFFGKTDSDAATWGLEKTEVEISGLRTKDTGGKWTGQTSFDATTDQISRALVFGANAAQLGFGKMPDYKHQFSEDFGIKSESAVEFWTESQKTILLAETEDYEQAKVAGTDWGTIAVDVLSVDVA